VILNLNKPEGFILNVTRMPDGQPHVKLDFVHNPGPIEPLLIRTRITNSEDLFVLLLVVDILRRRFGAGVELNLEVSYLMGGRMDRRIDVNQPFTLKVVTDILNGVGFSKIYLHHPHSDVSTALLNASVIEPKMFWLRAAWKFSEQVNYQDIAVASPDAGASKAVEAFAHENNFPFVQCLKTRKPETGQLHDIRVTNPENAEDKNVLILDDICDGGATFKGISEKLRLEGCRKIGLAVTHGIFSNGFKFGVDYIYTTNSYDDSILGAENIKVWDVFDLAELN
jgi:ribose-phosphate pyrophosphokinase